MKRVLADLGILLSLDLRLTAVRRPRLFARKMHWEL